MTDIEVIKSGVQTTIQDYPGRVGYWNVGIPPSGPMDNYAFRLGNKILGNDEACSALEVTLVGPELKFNIEAIVTLTGAPAQMIINGVVMPQWCAIRVKAGSTLSIQAAVSGLRTYLCFKGGLQADNYLNSYSTFTLGKFGGHKGRALEKGDVLNLNKDKHNTLCEIIDHELVPVYKNTWNLRVIYGPQGAPDFFTQEDIDMFFSTEWEIHYNSSRTGVRLIGPKPKWARDDGGEAGLHPSNLHDNPYAIGSIDFTGDMPVILGPDGPSLGGFVCPATIIQADLWKTGQLKPGDKIRFTPVSIEQANALAFQQTQSIKTLKASPHINTQILKPKNAIQREIDYENEKANVVYRFSGENNILIEYGEMILDIELRFKVHTLMHWINKNVKTGIIDLTPGIRSLQVHYDNTVINTQDLLEQLVIAEKELEYVSNLSVKSRIVHLPLSWNDPSTKKAIDIYMQSVRDDAPWCPDNIEFIRRINGLKDINDVKNIVFNANYLVMGLGDVYLGAPVATPLDPRHRLITTKYNPARTWTPENAVGIGGAYMCVYGMEGPGGYQFVGRTLQMWNRGNNNIDFEKEKPWLLRFFDQIKFFPVSEDELISIRKDFPEGKYNIKTEETEFNFQEYQKFLDINQDDINNFKRQQQIAFNLEKQNWINSGELKSAS